MDVKLEEERLKIVKKILKKKDKELKEEYIREAAYFIWENRKIALKKKN